MSYISYSEWYETMRCFVVIVFKPCFRICHEERPRKSGRIEIDWDTSASGLCQWC